MNFDIRKSFSIGTLMVVCFASGLAVAIWCGSSASVSVIPLETLAEKGNMPEQKTTCVLKDNLITPGQCGPPTTAPLFNAIREVESGGDDFAVGDGGRSRGPYQCGRAAWQDANEWLGTDLDYDVYVWDRATTERIMLAYWERYGCDTDEKRARCWNGGPRGMEKSATLGYWQKVRRAMK